MVSVGQHLKRLNRQRDRKVAEEAHAIESHYDLSDEDDRKHCREAIERLDLIYPKLQLKRRTWRWWTRWTLASLPAYVVTAFMVHALRHPELTETQRFLAFWDAMLWR